MHAFIFVVQHGYNVLNVLKACIMLAAVFLAVLFSPFLVPETVPMCHRDTRQRGLAGRGCRGGMRAACSGLTPSLSSSHTQQHS